MTSIKHETSRVARSGQKNKTNSTPQVKEPTFSHLALSLSHTHSPLRRNSTTLESSSSFASLKSGSDQSLPVLTKCIPNITKTPPLTQTLSSHPSKSTTLPPLATPPPQLPLPPLLLVPAERSAWPSISPMSPRTLSVGPCTTTSVPVTLLSSSM